MLARRIGQRIDEDDCDFGWARITAAVGATTHTYVGPSLLEPGRSMWWWCAEWIGAGTLDTATVGFVDPLLVGGAANGTPGNHAGAAGRVLRGLQVIAAGTHAVSIGANGVIGLATKVGALSSGIVHPGSGNAASTGSGGDGNAGGSVQWAGITSSITGESIEYARMATDGTCRPNMGDGWMLNITGQSTSGRAIIRVPAKFAPV